MHTWTPTLSKWGVVTGQDSHMTAATDRPAG